MAVAPPVVQTWERRTLIATAVVAAVVAALGLADAWQAVPLAHLGVAGVHTLFGVAMLRRSGREPGARLLRIVGLGWLAWAIGELSTAGEQIRSGAAVYPAFGDAGSLFIIPLLLAAAVVLPRHRCEPWERLRIASESLMLATALTVLWWTVLGVAQWPAPLTWPQQWLLVLVPLKCGLWALTFVLAMRQKTWPFTLLFITACVYVPVELVTGKVGEAGESPWLLGVMIVLAAGPAGVGAIRVRQNPQVVNERSAARAQSHRQVWTNSAAFATFLASIGVLMGGSDSGTFLSGWFGVMVIAVVMVFAVSLWLRDFARLQQFIYLTDQLSEMAFSDPLTKVGNRRALEAFFEQAWERPLGRAGPPVSLLTVDLDGFKDVNTLLGHGSGDQLLSSVGGALSKVCGRDNVYRMGGDEFAVTWLGNTQGALALGEQILDEVRDVSMQLPGVGRVGLSASIGIATMQPGQPDEGGHVGHWSTLLLRSGEAMRSAKTSGKAQVALYSRPMAEATRRRSAIERRMRDQLAGPGVTVRYQPLVHLATGKLIGFEALAHWNDEDLGLLQPAEFIAVAEDTGLISDLGHQVLVRALADLHESGAAASGLWMSVNVSALQLRSPGFIGVVVEALSKARIPASQLVIEVTESLSIADGDVAAETLQTLSELGVVVALDDFGTGYSSLAYLSRLPVQLLKLDREIAQNLASPRVRSVAKAVIDMATSLQVDVLAEGLESADHVEQSRAIGATLPARGAPRRPVRTARALAGGGAPAVPRRQRVAPAESQLGSSPRSLPNDRSSPGHSSSCAARSESPGSS